MKQSDGTLSFRDKVNSGLARNWRLAFIILGVAVITMVIILVMDGMQKKQRAESAVLTEDIQKKYIDWKQSLDEDRDSQELEDLIDQALSEYPKRFAAQRALFVRGLMALENEDWLPAAEAFQNLVDRWNTSYLAPISLFNAASAQEQAGNVDAAKDAWQMLVDTYGDMAPDVPEALFNLARLAEGRDDMEAALEHYKQITSRFPDSRWTDLSKNRILVIEGRS